MSSTCKYFGVITARAGSKGIPDKNMQLIGNKPMIQFTFEAASGSSNMDSFILSTDDHRIIELANKLNILAPFVRPDYLCGDKTPTKDVINHSLEWYKENYKEYPENILLLQPTSPFRTSDDIDNAIMTYEKSEKESLISVCLASQYPSECLIINPDSTLNFINIGTKAFQRQSYSPAYFIDGAIYISRTKRFIEKQTFFDQDSSVHILPKSHCIDIDDYFTLFLARAMNLYSEEIDNDIFNY